MQTKHVVGIVIGLILIMMVFAYNGMVGSYEDVQQSIGQVNNVYQRRLDLIPNLVETVKGYATHEKGTLEGVTQARAAASQIKISSDMKPEDLAKWQEAQGQLGTALSRLMMIKEAYPDLKANQNFMNLQAELAGTENRIAVERRTWLLKAKYYNVKIKTFPNSLFAGFFGFKPTVYFEADEGAKTAPKVKF